MESSHWMFQKYEENKEEFKKIDSMNDAYTKAMHHF